MTRSILMIRSPRTGMELTWIGTWPPTQEQIDAIYVNKSFKSAKCIATDDSQLGK